MALSLFSSLLILTALSYILSFLVINPPMATNMRSTQVRAVILTYGYVQFVLGFLSAYAVLRIQGTPEIPPPNGNPVRPRF